MELVFVVEMDQSIFFIGFDFHLFIFNDDKNFYFEFIKTQIKTLLLMKRCKT